MTHDELLAKVTHGYRWTCDRDREPWDALRAVVELHTGSGIANRCVSCSSGSKCETIQVIEKELK